MSKTIPQNTRQCSTANCTNPVVYPTLGLCKSHYSMQRRLKTTNVLCSTPDCGRKVHVVKRGLCIRCYQFWRATQITPESPRCKVPDCDLPLCARGYCSPHYSQFNKFGEIRPRHPQKNRRKIKKMEGSYLTSSGYRRIVIPGRGHMLEHRYVIEQKLGRYLLPGENVHHIDGNKLNNAPENLELWVTRQPQGQRIEDAVAWAREILQRYG